MISILGANSVSGDYEVSNSLRFNDGDTAKLARTPSGASNRKTWTWSGWVKRSTLGAIQGLFVVDTGSAESALGFLANDTLRFYQTGQTNGLVTNAVFRDLSAWYHIVLISDTTQSTESSRTKLYINGEQVTSFSAAEYLSQNADTEFNTTNPHEIGFYSNQTGGAGHFDGYMAEVNFIDGTAKAHTDFGETNDNNVWVPIKYTGTYGTNGFFLQFKQTGTSANSSGIGADTSGNDNHFAVTNLAATDVTTDTCTNNFATIFPFSADSGNISEGNLKYTSTTDSGTSTISVSSGKWYVEMCVNSNNNSYLGVIDVSANGINPNRGGDWTSTGAIAYKANGEQYSLPVGGSASTASYGSSYTSGDIIGIALDITSDTITFYKNNVSQGNTTNGPSDIQSNGSYSFFIYGTNSTITFNAGQDSSFAGAKTAQNNADGNGYGDFYYSPPSGYYALNTKNLAEFG